ncbi:MAG: UTP--glucose-1-phosphate uridylyltransferase [bacterium]|jgi:UTP--glucose-1-phosphate uridylyltransferase
MDSFNTVKEIMLSQGSSIEHIRVFKKLFKNFKEEKTKKIKWESISTPQKELIIEYKSLEEPNKEEISTLLSSLAVCKLNGGLGSSMGCVGPKSAIEVREGKTFLDLIVSQIKSLNQEYNADVPLVLMNSFNTHQDTKKIIHKYREQLQVLTFQQHEFPRIRNDTLLPLAKDLYGSDASYPPGHGDFYASIYQSGTLDTLLEQGKDFIFVGNADNLGANVDLKILNHMKNNDIPFIMEVTPKTRADVKGGTIIQKDNGTLCLLEIAQVSKEHREEFKSVKKFKFFNTNNIWVNLRALKAKLENGGLDLDIIRNKKTVHNIPVIQLETAIGAGINNFQNSCAVNVPRSRFLPVKKTDDLLLVQSNLFKLNDGLLIRNPERQFEGLPLIRLGEFFKTVEDYHERMTNIPDILELDLLTIVGDVHFGRNVTLRGNVIVVCEQEELHLPDHSLLENKVLTGSIKVGEL